jgi:6-phosphogluconolactonase (cycloisomerase 2 family)
MSIHGTAYSLTIDPSRRFVYVPDGDYAYIAQFRIGPNGTLRTLSPPTVQVNSHPSAVVCHPNGRFVYVPCSHGGIYQFRRRQDGTLVPLTPAVVSMPGEAVRDPAIIAFHDSGHQAIVMTDEGFGMSGNSRSRYRIAADGTLHFLRKQRLP